MTKQTAIEEVLASAAKAQKTTITIRVDPGLLERLKRQAEIRGVKYTALLWGLVSHGLVEFESQKVAKGHLGGRQSRRAVPTVA